MISDSHPLQQVGNLDEMLRLVAELHGADPQLVLDRVHYVGLTKASLGWTYWRKDEESQGARFFAEGRASVVPISTRLWCHLSANGSGCARAESDGSAHRNREACSSAAQHRPNGLARG